MYSKIIFWDVDTQRDFMEPEGSLYVPGAEKIKENLGKLTQYARLNKIRILGSVDFHSDTDPEIERENPDYKETFPPHCMKDDPMQEKIMETRSDITLWIDTDKYKEDRIEEIVNGIGPIIFRKTELDAFSNPNIIPILDSLQPKNIVVYGVAIDFCVKMAIEGLLKRDKYSIYLVIDAIEGIDEEKSKILIEEWVDKGVNAVTTEAVLQGSFMD
ncbi:MAG: cysteine hydrolase family protein [Candidatus Thorarchaeota archaeon]